VPHPHLPLDYLSAGPDLDALRRQHDDLDAVGGNALPNGDVLVVVNLGIEGRDDSRSEVKSCKDNSRLSDSCEDEVVAISAGNRS
jgi:hypothetical protein